MYHRSQRALYLRVYLRKQRSGWEMCKGKGCGVYGVHSVVVGQAEVRPGRGRRCFLQFIITTHERVEYGGWLN
jgi:hypothetical protein